MAESTIHAEIRPKKLPGYQVTRKEGTCNEGRPRFGTKEKPTRTSEKKEGDKKDDDRRIAPVEHPWRTET